MGKREKNKEFEIEIIGGEELTEQEIKELSKYFSDKKANRRKKSNTTKKEKA